jgi:hypothetical protein
LKVTFAKIVILFRFWAKVPVEQPPAGQASPSEFLKYFDGWMKGRQPCRYPDDVGAVAEGGVCNNRANVVIAQYNNSLGEITVPKNSRNEMNPTQEEPDKKYRSGHCQGEFLSCGKRGRVR